MPEAIDVDAEYEQAAEYHHQQQHQQQHHHHQQQQQQQLYQPFPTWGEYHQQHQHGYHTVNSTGGAINYDDALQKAAIYVNRIKGHFHDRPDSFRQFLELLRLHKTNMIAVQDVYNDVSNLLSGSQELLDEFSMFLPEVIRCSINSQLGEIRADNVEAWVSEAAPAFPICVIFVAPKGPLMYPSDFHDLVAHMRGCIAFAILDVNLQSAVGHAMLNASRMNHQAQPPTLPVWKLYHKGMHCAEASGWPTSFTLQNLLHTHSKQYGWKAITAANGQQPALQPGRMMSSHSSAFKPAAVSGARSGGAFSAVGTGKMSLNNMLSGSSGVHVPTIGGSMGGGISESSASVAPHDDGSSIAGGTETQHETLEERKIRRRKEKKKKRKREKKERRREEKRLRKEAAIARTAAYTESASGPEAKAEIESAPDNASGSARAAETSPSSTDGHQSPEADGEAAKEGEREEQEEQDDDTDDDDDDEHEDEQKVSDTSHLVQSKNARGRPQRSAAVAAEAISAASNATTDREARREERERRNREKAKEPLVERKPDARSLRLAAKGLYFSPGQEYFHCRTGVVIRKDEASLVDSDDDVDTTWIQKQNEDLMDEFTDVSQDEKTFMKLWNDFMQGFGAYSDYYVSPKCVEFTQERVRYLVENKLRQCLIFHLFQLWDLGLVEKECVDECVELYDVYEAAKCRDRPAAAEGDATTAAAAVAAE